jgi:hypothetical protein
MQLRLPASFRSLLRTPRPRLLLFGLAMAVPVGTLVAAPALAQSLTTGLQSMVALTIAYAAYYLSAFFGLILIEATSILVWVASYNGFATAQPVVVGWTIVRDVANMFFILALLLIAFGTILGIDSYSYKNKQLSRLLIMAVVVNFSRTIAGLIIDFSQVIMLTFVNGFAQAAGGNFMNAFRINELYSSAPNILDAVKGDVQENIAWGIMLSMVLAVGMTAVSLATVIVMTVALVWRIATLWLLIIMSPLAFFLGGVPGGFASGYYGKWWEQFKEQVVFGPFMAFFLWLALVSVASSGNLLGSEPARTGESVGASFSAAFNSGSLGSFMIAIALMLGGLSMAKGMSSAVGMGVQAKDKLAGAAKGALKWGAAKVDKASGFAAYRKMSSARKEAATEEKYKARGMALDAGLAKFGGGVKGGAAGMLGAGGRLQSMKSRISSLKSEEDYLRQLGGSDNIAKADALKAKAAGLEGDYANMGRFRRGVDAVGGAVAGAPARFFGAGATAEGKVVSEKQRATMEKEQKKLANKSMQEITRMSQDDAVVESEGQRTAAIMEAVKRGVPDMNGRVEKAREQLLASGVDAASLKEFDDNARKNYFMEGRFDMYDEKRDASIKKDMMDAGKFAISVDTPDKAIEQQAVNLATSKKRAKYQEDMNAGQKKAYSETLKKALDEARGLPASERGTDANKAREKALEAAIMETASTADKDSAAYRENLQQTYGVAGGGFAAGADGKKKLADLRGDLAAKTDDASKEALRKIENIVSAAGGRGGENMLLSMRADELVADDGTITQLGEAIFEAMDKNRGALSIAAKNAEGKPDAEQTMRALVQIVKKKGDDNFKKTVEKGRGYENYGKPYRVNVADAAADAAAEAEKAAKATEKATKEAAAEAEKQARKDRDQQLRDDKYTNS